MAADRSQLTEDRPYLCGTTIQWRAAVKLGSLGLTSVEADGVDCQQCLVVGGGGVGISVWWRVGV